MMANYWLLVWNPNKWEWENYNEWCEQTKQGKIFHETWRCANTHAQKGDEFFIVKLGENPKGIFAHGFLTTNTYTDEENTKQVGINLDYIINYKNEKILDLEMLEENFENQRWNPQSSGIEIKREYIDDLKIFWNELIEGVKTMNNQENEKTISLVNLLEANKNLILHGAPGTGKTYTAKDVAAQMICGKPFSQIESGSEDEKLFNEQTEFVQFHPSYDYSDFVEGLRPIEGENTGEVGFERKDGVFKEFCGKALNFANTKTVTGINNFDEAWNKLLEYVRNEMSEGRLVKIGNWEYSVSNANSLKYQSIGTKSNYSFTITKENVYLAYQHKKGRPSGYFQKEMEDTVNFMKENFKLSPFSENPITTPKTSKLPYIFIIDEINRGEMSKIFGELFFSIDPDYRGTKGKVRTQYANMLDEQNDFDDALGITNSFGHFFVPENVYIIGTMNDIDRSVDSMDFAMRRRFTFVELKANECLGMFDNLNLPNGISRSEIEAKMTVLNAEIEKIPGLSSAYHIGGSYFAKLSKYFDKPKDEAFECLWNNHLKPLITDYLRGLPNLETKLSSFKEKYDKAGN